MPAETTEPHPMTVRQEGHKASCYNRNPFNSSYVAIDGIALSAKKIVINTVDVQHRMSTKCRQGVYETLPECEGCTSEKDLEYIERMRGVK